MKAPIVGNLWAEGISPETPQKCEGILMLPPMSFPMPIGETPEARAAPYPPELPPTDFLLFQGLRHLPHRKLLESKLKASCGRLVWTKGMSPLFFKHLITYESSLQSRLALALSPMVDAFPWI